MAPSYAMNTGTLFRIRVVDAETIQFVLFIKHCGFNDLFNNKSGAIIMQDFAGRHL